MSEFATDQRRTWTTLMREALIALWSQTPVLSTQKIADRINERLGTKLTKNSVAGERRRLKLPERGSPIAFDHEIKRRKAAMAARIESGGPARVQHRRRRAAAMRLETATAAKDATLAGCQYIAKKEGPFTDADKCGDERTYTVRRGEVVRSPYCDAHHAKCHLMRRPAPTPPADSRRAA